MVTHQVAGQFLGLWLALLVLKQMEHNEMGKFNSSILLSLPSLAGAG